MAETPTNSSGGIGFLEALTLLLIGLKLMGKIDCSWLIVFGPAVVYWLIAGVLMLAIWWQQ